MIEHSLLHHGDLTPFGIMVHSTGDGIPARILKENIAPEQAAIDVYSSMAAADGTGPHYCIVPNGQIIKFREPNTHAWHAAVSSTQRADFLSAQWESDPNRISAALVAWWKLRWQGVRSPQHLYPAVSPNQSYIGVELVPCGSYSGNSWQPLLGTPATPKGRYTAQQYTSAALLALALGTKYAFPAGWFEGQRMVGHEDVNPYTRPGWDPGSFNGWFSWSIFRGICRSLVMNGALDATSA